MHDYLEAEHIGQSSNVTCASAFPKCPISLYNLLGDQEDFDDNLVEDVEQDDESSLKKSHHYKKHTNINQPDHYEHLKHAVGELGIDGQFLDESANSIAN